MKSLEELRVIREKAKKHACRYRVHVCGGTGCTSSGSLRIIEKLEQEIKANGLEEDVEIVKTGCFGLCALGPIMIVHPEGSFFHGKGRGYPGDRFRASQKRQCGEAAFV